MQNLRLPLSYTESEFMVYQNHPSVRPKAVGANILNNHSDIKSDFKRNIYALYAAEISGKLVPYNVENQEKYFLIARIWELLASCKNPRRAVIAFILRFLRLSGYSFIEYIGQNPAIFDYDTQQNIKKLSNCSGNDIDDFDFNDEKIWNCVEVYLSNYIKKPLVGTFLKKLNVI